MLGAFTRTASLLRSVVTRVGQAIPDVISLALRPDDDFLVLRECKLPLTQTATEIVKNNRTSSGIEVRSDTQILGTFDTDLIVIERKTRHATLIECVRGSVALSGPRTKALVHKVRVAALSARSALESEGHRINTVSGTVYDRYGRSGHEDAMTVRAREIDAFLGVPVICYLDRLDERIREALVEVIDPAADEDTGTAVDPGRNPEAVDRVTVDSRQPEDVTASTPSRPALTRPAVDLSRSIGPAEWRRMLEAADRDNDCFLPN
ncbi:hypothetical protein [Aurantimonas coralicida]|uniref:hypothetical protein n=1 Tax=Aurantimonas coralicida TaxID=182270 RepID=UPI001E3D649F|nr:hypothetical protein [Aurantimonas coralicida]MCD1645360.1 hypothetical protein [Aurantimonas coralicida]